MTHGPATYRAAILLSAFGNSRYLRDQVNSIVQQMDPRDILVIVDDGSRVVPWNAIESWPQNFLAWSRLQQSGASRSFLSLIVHSTVHAEHYFLSDQDDLWLAGKINDQLLAHINHGAGLHASTHCWTCIRPQRAQPQFLNVERPTRPLPCLSFGHYFFETPAPGMTLSFNASCRELLETQEELLLAMADQLPHDRVLFAFLSMHAKIHVLDKVLVLYRQHIGNLVGSPSPNAWKRWSQRLGWPRRAWRTATRGLALYQQFDQTLERSDAPRYGSLSTMRLRSDLWDNRALHFFLRCRAALLRLRNGR